MKKIKIIAMLVACFVVFATTFFAIADNKNGSSLFLDSDQDGLSDQQEKLIGTDPKNPDTDNDGYFDGEEIKSCYNPLKPAPGDKLASGQCTAVQKILTDPTNTQPLDPPLPAAAATNSQSANGSQAASADLGSNTGNQSDLIAAANLDPASSDMLSQLTQTGTSNSDPMSDVTSDPNNPNLTNEMIGQFMQLTTQKGGSTGDLTQTPTYSAADLNQISQGALQTVDLTKNLPNIQDNELNILPEVKGKNMSADEIKAQQKTEIEKYLAQAAFIFASNSPFAVTNLNDLSSNLNSESTALVTAIATGDTSKVESYAQKAQAGIDQMKKMEVPYVLKDVHKSMLQLAIYTLSLKDDLSLNTADPMKGLLSASSLQAVTDSAMQVQDAFSKILSDYGIDSVNFPS